MTQDQKPVGQKEFGPEEAANPPDSGTLEKFDQAAAQVEWKKGREQATKSIKEKIKLAPQEPLDPKKSPEEQIQQLDELAFNAAIVMGPLFLEHPELSSDVFLRNLDPGKITDQRLMQTAKTLRAYILENVQGPTADFVRANFESLFTEIKEAVLYTKQFSGKPDFLERLKKDPKGEAKKLLHETGEAAKGVWNFVRENPGGAGIAIVGGIVLYEIFKSTEGKGGGSGESREKKSWMKDLFAGSLGALCGGLVLALFSGDVRNWIAEKTEGLVGDAKKRAIEGIIDNLPEWAQPYARKALTEEKEGEAGFFEQVYIDGKNKINEYAPWLDPDTILPSVEDLKKFANEHNIPQTGAAAAGAGLLTLYFRKNIVSVAGKILGVITRTPGLAVRLAMSPVGLVAVLVGLFTLFGVDKASAESELEKGGIISKITGFFSSGDVGKDPNEESKELGNDGGPDSVQGKFKHWWEGESGSGGKRREWAMKIRGDGKSETRNAIANTVATYGFADSEMTALTLTGGTFAAFAIRALLMKRFATALKLSVPAVFFGWLLGKEILSGEEDIPEKADLMKELSPANSAEMQDCFRKGQEGLLTQYKKQGVIAHDVSLSDMADKLPEELAQLFSSTKLEEMWNSCKNRLEKQNPALWEELLLGGSKVLAFALFALAISQLLPALKHPKKTWGWIQFAMMSGAAVAVYEGAKWTEDLIFATGEYAGNLSNDLNILLAQLKPELKKKLIPEWDGVQTAFFALNVDLPSTLVKGEQVKELQNKLVILEGKMHGATKSTDDFTHIIGMIREMIAAQNKGDQSPVLLSSFHFARLALAARENDKTIKPGYNSEDNTYTLEIDGVLFEGFPENPIAGLEEFPGDNFEVDQDIDNRMTALLVKGLENIVSQIPAFTPEREDRLQYREPIIGTFTKVLEKIKGGSYADFTIADLAALQRVLASAGFVMERAKNGMELNVRFPNSPIYSPETQFAGIAPGITRADFAANEEYLYERIPEAILYGWWDSMDNVVANTMRDMEKHAQQGSPLLDVIRDMKTAPQHMRDTFLLVRFLKAINSSETDIAAKLENGLLTLAYGSKNMVFEIGQDIVAAASDIFTNEFADKDTIIHEAGIGGALIVGVGSKLLDSRLRGRSYVRTARFLTKPLAVGMYDIPGLPLKAGFTAANRSLRIAQNPLAWARLKGANLVSQNAELVPKASVKHLTRRYVALEREIAYWEKSYHGPSGGRIGVVGARTKITELKKTQQAVENVLSRMSYRPPGGTKIDDMLREAAKIDPLVIRFRNMNPLDITDALHPVRYAGTEYRSAFRAARLKTVLNTLPSLFSAGAAGMTLYESFNEPNPEIKKLKLQQAGVQITIVGVELAAWGAAAAAMWGGRALKIATPVGWVLLTADVLSQAGFESAEEAKRSFEDIFRGLTAEEISESGLLDKISALQGLSFGDSVRAVFKTVIEGEFDGDAFRAIRNEKPGMRKLRFQALLSFRLSQKNPESLILKNEYYHDNFVRWQMAYIEKKAADFLVADFIEASKLAHESELFAIQFVQVLEQSKIEDNLDNTSIAQLAETFLPQMLAEKDAIIPKLLSEEEAERNKNVELTSALHAGLYSAAKLYSYTGKSDLESLQKFFTKADKNSHRIYWDEGSKAWWACVNATDNATTLRIDDTNVDRLTEEAPYTGYSKLLHIMQAGASEYKAAKFKRAA